MREPGPSRKGGDPKLHRVVLEDLRREGLSGSLRRDLRDLYRFYLNEEQRTRLEAMGPVRRFLWRVGWLFKNMLLKLPPARRLLLVFALLLGWLGLRFRFDEVAWSFNGWPWAFLILLVILMLELKDKLLARDEIEVARQVQLSLLPRSHPDLSGWEIWSCSRPANDVGGDLVDYLDLGPGRLGVVLGDVAGKGMGAALLSAKLQATLRALAPECPSLVDLGSRLNAVFERSGLDNRYATLFYFEIGETDGRLRLLNAGHNPAVVLRKDSIETVPPSSSPIGMLPTTRYVESDLHLSAGDVLVVYSDGLTEARDEHDEEFGEDRLIKVLRRGRTLAPEQLGRTLLEEVDRFLGSERGHDDVSIVVLRRGL